MSNDRITAVNNLGIVTSLIEHSDIKTKYVSHIYSSAHCTFIRADDHHVIIIELEVLELAAHSLYELISRLNCLKSVKRDSILYSGIMSIESYDVVDAHRCHFLKCICTVKRLT